MLDKSRVFSYVEYRTVAICHASTVVLSVCDSRQERCSNVLEVSAETALLEFSLALLSSHQDIAIFGRSIGPFWGLGLVRSLN
eukprot:6224120-Pyramimonas_sp.AAC.1